MSVILTQRWETANEATTSRGVPLPRHAIPSGTPSYFSTILAGETISGSIILPVNKWEGLDAAGQNTDHTHTQYGQVIICDKSMALLRDAGLVDDDTKIFHNFQECCDEIRSLNNAQHETYLTNYQNGNLSKIASWDQKAGAAQTAQAMRDQYNDSKCSAMTLKL